MLKLIKKVIPIKTRQSLLNLLEHTPPCCIKNAILNYLGWNPLRSIFFNSAYNFRSTRVELETAKPYLEELNKNGVVAINSFLPDTDFRTIENEYNSLEFMFRESQVIKTPTQKRLWIAARNVFLNNCEDLKLSRLLLKNELLNNIVEIASRRKVKMLPSTAFSLEQYAEGDIGKVSNNLTYLPHYDVPYHSYKAFYLVNDVDESNGAFHYSLGSQKFNFRRLLLEYFTSINISKNTYPQVNYSQSKHFERYEKNMTAMTGKANTLIIFDAMGIHRRGDFSTTKPRKMIQMCYRNIESKRNKYFNSIDRIIVS